MSTSGQETGDVCSCQVTPLTKRGVPLSCCSFCWLQAWMSRLGQLPQPPNWSPVQTPHNSQRTLTIIRVPFPEPSMPSEDGQGLLLSDLKLSSQSHLLSSALCYPLTLLSSALSSAQSSGKSHSSLTMPRSSAFPIPLPTPGRLLGILQDPAQRVPPAQSLS